MLTGMEGRSLHRKCTGDHEHIPIQGQYTKPSYTDELAEAVADRFDVALKAKLRTERPSMGGLENLLCNDVLLSGQWSPCGDGRNLCKKTFRRP